MPISKIIRRRTATARFGVTGTKPGEHHITVFYRLDEARYPTNGDVRNKVVKRSWRKDLSDTGMVDDATWAFS